MVNYSWMSAGRTNSKPTYVAGSEEFTTSIPEKSIRMSVWFENSPYETFNEGTLEMDDGEIIGTFKCEWEASATGGYIKIELRELEINQLRIYNEGFDDYDEGQYSAGDEYETYVNFSLSWVDDEIENGEAYGETELLLTIDCHDSLDSKKWTCKAKYELQHGE